MHIAVIGTGYVGLVVGAGLAQTGNDVICADIDQGKISRLQRGEIPIYEPGLESMVQQNAAQGRLGFTTDVAAAVRPARVVFIAVGTPPGLRTARRISSMCWRWGGTRGRGPGMEQETV